MDCTGVATWKLFTCIFTLSMRISFISDVTCLLTLVFRLAFLVWTSLTYYSGSFPLFTVGSVFHCLPSLSFLLLHARKGQVQIKNYYKQYAR